jgi:hypothetical protein
MAISWLAKPYNGPNIHDLLKRGSIKIWHRRLLLERSRIEIFWLKENKTISHGAPKSPNSDRCLVGWDLVRMRISNIYRIPFKKWRLEIHFKRLLKVIQKTSTIEK